MAGGTYTAMNKVRPGVYINFESEPKPLGSLGERGIVTFALPLSWGVEKEVLEIEAGENVRAKLGYSLTDPELLLVREALKRAKKVILYRLNEGTKATATADTLTITAKYSGIRGNDISIAVQKNIDDATKFDVQTLVEGAEMDLQTVESIEQLHSNDWVTFSGTGVLTETAGISLANGSDGTATNEDHLDYLCAIEVFEFNTIGLTAADTMLKSLYSSFVHRLRSDEGIKVQLVVENYPIADGEGVISVKNGVILSDGTALSANQAVAWVAGATAAADVNESLTYQAYDDAVDAEPRYTNSQIEAALKNGEFVFVQSNGLAMVEQDINTLKSFSPKKGKHFSKNRVIRVLDGINQDIKRIFEKFYIGKVDNNADGRNLLRNELNNYLLMLQNVNAIQNFDAQKDVTIQAGSDSDSVYVEVHVQPVDSIEKIYMKVQVK
ncbi:phage tail sheath family protein [Cytobacillus solani]|uniref:phage tail sheath family protein n=1 Tax=Cytobacillus solani TaxID=1637975 RepID=UPI00115084DB|nr:phage tail sheath family protein [Cytobacillus solani]